MKFYNVVLIFIFLLQGCTKELPTGYDFEVFSKEMNVFGITILATEETSNNKMVHAATILAEYLDNDENGAPDNSKVVDALVSHQATLVMFKSYGSKKYKQFFSSSKWPNGQTTDRRAIQDLYDDETHPNGAANGIFDASLEEVLHLITFGGYSNAYPEIFGTKKGTAVSKAVDLARGGYFDYIPEKYPENAWYSYDDETCEYGCQIHEYLYWVITSILGAQDFPGRFDEIRHEWRLNTHEKVRNIDKAFYALYTNTEYKLPTVLPDGKYKGRIPNVVTFQKNLTNK